MKPENNITSTENSVSQTANINGEGKKIKKKKIIFLTSITILILMLIFLGIVGLPHILSFFMGKDVAPIDDRDLMLVDINLLESKNMFYDLESAGKKVVKSENIDLAADYLESDQWNKETAENFFKINAEALSEYDKASKKDKFQVPALADPGKVSSSFVVSTDGWETVAKTSIAKAVWLAEKDRYDEAFSEIFKTVKIGHAIERSQIDMNGYLSGMAIKSMGLNGVEKILSMTDLDSRLLIEYQDLMKMYPTEINTSVIKYEYMIYKNKLQDNFFVRDALGPDLPSSDMIQNDYYYKPNLTSSYLVDIIKQYIEDSDSVCNIRKEIGVGSKIKGVSGFSYYLKMFLTENSVGESLLSTIEPSLISSLNNMRSKECDIEIMQRVVDISFAMKKYVYKNIEYPDSIDDLVPDYIADIPNDPYSNEQFIYDKANKSIKTVSGNENQESTRVFDLDFINKTENPWKRYISLDSGISFRYPNFLSIWKEPFYQSNNTEKYFYPPDVNGEDCGFGFDEGCFSYSFTMGYSEISVNDPYELLRDGEESGGISFKEVKFGDNLFYSWKLERSPVMYSISKATTQFFDNYCLINGNYMLTFSFYYFDNTPHLNAINNILESVIIEKDSDQDGLFDGMESIYGTDMFNPDTDNDGYKDGEEVKKGFNPKGDGPLPFIPEINK